MGGFIMNKTNYKEVNSCDINSIFSSTGMILYLIDSVESQESQNKLSESSSFSLIHSGAKWTVPTVLTKSSLAKMMPPCFKEYVLNVLDKAVMVKSIAPVEFSLKICTSLKVYSPDYYQCHMSFDFNQYGLYRILIIPLRKKSNDSFWFHIVKAGEFDDSLKEFMSSLLTPPCLGFTAKQKKIFRLIQSGMTTDQICRELKTNKNNIYKYFGRMKEILSDFFEIEFDKIHDAAFFYLKCFGKV